MACLLTRIPYDTEISEGMLRMIEDAEDSSCLKKDIPEQGSEFMVILQELNVLPGYLEKIINDPEREHIVANLKKIGFRYISLDLEGYRTGSMNPEQKIK